MPLFTFSEEYDFSGKTIIPFASHEESSLGSGVSIIKELCPDATVLEGLAIRGGDINSDSSRQSVEDWINRIDLKLSQE